LNDAVIIRRKAMPIPVDKYASHEEYVAARREFIKGAEGAIPNVHVDNLRKRQWILFLR